MASNESPDPLRELLEQALERGIGVAFEPSETGWRISYLTPYRLSELEEYELGGGTLAAGGDLDAASSAALTPLLEIAEEIDEVGESEA